MIERALFLSRLEFSVLLMAGEVEEIGCFALPRAEEVDEKQIIRAVYSLVKKGFMQVEDHELRLSEEIEEMIISIKASARYLLMEFVDETQPQRIIYLGKLAVILENTVGTEQDFRLFSKEKEAFWTWIEESMDVPAFVVPVRDEAAKLLAMNELALRELEILKECSCSEGALGMGLQMKKIQEKFGQTSCIGIRLIQSYDGRILGDLILCLGCANLWFLWCSLDKDLLSGQEKQIKIMPDAIETRKEFQALFWRKEE